MEGNMARRVFFSFHYQRDIWRVNQIRNIGEIVGTAAVGFHDASLWEEAKKKGDTAIKKMIDDALLNTSVMGQWKLAARRRRRSRRRSVSPFRGGRRVDRGHRAGSGERIGLTGRPSCDWGLYRPSPSGRRVGSGPPADRPTLPSTADG